MSTRFSPGKQLLLLVVAFLCFRYFGLTAKAQDGPRPETTLGISTTPSPDPSAINSNTDIVPPGGQANWREWYNALPQVTRDAMTRTSDAKEQRLLRENITTEVAPLPAGVFYDKKLSLEQEWKEPNDIAHRNYCGPGATQVALDVRLAGWLVPSVDTLGAEEHIDPNKGVYATDIRTVLNARLNTTWYVVNAASDATKLSDWLKSDLTSTYAMVTGLKTANMPGWGSRDVDHIVAAYGYYESSDGSMKYATYAETAAVAAGYNGSFSNTVGLNSFWNFVVRNNTQVW